MSGTGKWMHRLKIKDTKFDEAGVYHMDFYPANEGELRKLLDAGFKSRPKEDEDGKFVKLKRKHEAQMGKELVSLGPPKIIDKDGNETDVLPGNGSKVTVKVVLYDTAKFGKGSRLETVRIDELVEYVKEEAPATPETTGKPNANKMVPF